MKTYRVRFWHQDQDGREDIIEFGTIEEAMGQYKKFGGMAEIQKWDEERRMYIDVLPPIFRTLTKQ